jgi:NADH dehydrogenase FAD-containing subunit
VLGSETRFFGMSDEEQNAFSIKTLDDASGSMEVNDCLNET